MTASKDLRVRTLTITIEYTGSPFAVRDALQLALDDGALQNSIVEHGKSNGRPKFQLVSVMVR